MRITRFAVERRRATAAMVLALLVLGVYGFRLLPVDFLPDVTYPLIKVHIWWRGATPEEIDRNVADPLERQMSQVDDLDYLQSSSIEGQYTLLLNCRYGADVNVAYQDAIAAMARAARNLPPDMDPPVILKADPSQLPVLQVAVSSSTWDLVRLRTWVDEWLQDRLIAVPGVAGTEVVGGLRREIRVQVDPVALEKHGLALDTVVRRLDEENVERFAGRVTTRGQEIIARTTAEFRDLDEIRDVVLLRRGLDRVRLRDVAEVVDGSEEVRVVTRLGGKPCVKVSVLKQVGANTVDVARAVARRLAAFEPVVPPGVRFTLLENQADYVNAAVTGVRNAAFQAAVLLVLVVFLFLGSWRQALIMILALPLTVLVNFGLMKVMGFSLNIFSLGGLVVAVGVVLDNSIVVLENIVRLRDERPEEPLASVCIDAVDEVGPAVIASTVSYLALFVPFLLVPGLMALLFRELVLVIAGIVVVSLAVAVAVTPLLARTVMKRERSHGAGAGVGRFARVFALVTETYGTVLASVLRRKWVVFVAFVAILVAGAVALKKVGREFLPMMDDGRVIVKVRLPTGAAVGETDRLLRTIEERLARDSLVESAFTMAGGRVWGIVTYEVANEGEIDLQLVPRARRTMSTRAYIARLRSELGRMKASGGKIMVQQMRLKGIRKMGDADIELEISGPDTQKLFDLARRSARELASMPELANVHVSLDLTKPEFKVVLDREKAAELGVTARGVAAGLRTLVGGSVACRFRDGEELYGIRVIVPEERILSRRDLEELILPTNRGAHVRLRDIARVVRAVGPVEIVREKQVKQVIVRADVARGSIGDAVDAVKRRIALLDRPAGYAFEFGGKAQMMGDMGGTVIGIVAFAVLFSFIALVVQFDSVKLPAVILALVPVTVVGMVLALYASGLFLGATVGIALLVVIAAVVNDGVLLITFAEELRTTAGLSAVDATLQAAKIRLRPRVMTTLTTLVSFIPLALNIEDGSDMLQPMAVAAIGGLSLEIVIALFFMPCLYAAVVRDRPAEEEPA